MIATEEQTSQQAPNSQTPDKLDMNSRKNIMKNMYSQSKRNQGTDSAYTDIRSVTFQKLVLDSNRNEPRSKNVFVFLLKRELALLPDIADIISVLF